MQCPAFELQRGLENRTWKTEQHPNMEHFDVPISNHHGFPFSIGRDPTKKNWGQPRSLWIKKNFNYTKRPSLAIIRFLNGRNHEPNKLDHPKSEHVRISSLDCIFLKVLSVKVVLESKSNFDQSRNHVFDLLGIFRDHRVRLLQIHWGSEKWFIQSCISYGKCITLIYFDQNTGHQQASEYQPNKSPLFRWPVFKYLIVLKYFILKCSLFTCCQVINLLK